MANAKDVNVEERTRALQKLLRGEMAAVDGYERLLERMDPAPELDEIRRITADHRRAVSLLRQHISEAGEDPDDSAGPWGRFAVMFEESARLLGGDTMALKGLKEGEVHGTDDYRTALSHTGLGPEVRTLVMEDLLPCLEEHVRTLDAMIGHREQHFKEEGLRDRIERQRGGGAAAD